MRPVTHFRSPLAATFVLFAAMSLTACEDPGGHGGGGQPAPTQPGN